MIEKATFGAGCFWGVEARFAEEPGVTETAVGYEGGHMANPTYRDVCTDETGHAEVVELDFDPQKTSYEHLVRLFFQLHDPTQLNRQGPDFGTQYRSVIFYHSPEQKATAERVKEEMQKTIRGTIVTAIEPAGKFNRAEEYHQKYLVKRGAKSCHI
ncbi:MAG TPA: peptide-methionine (S)-S-oxide reductase MsrA [Terriglobales bacterium]|nr:peptide-methionine (S)-S-oxide reductase MsrA [Terriglobales bacterium]